MRMNGNAGAMDTPARWPNGRARGVQRVSYTHLAIADAILLDPCISQTELAARFGYSQGWVSQILSSSTFRVRLAERAAELTDPGMRASVDERIKTLVARSLDIVSEKLDRPADRIPDQLVLRALEVSVRALGGSIRRAEAPSPADAEAHLEDLSDRLTALLRRERGLE